MKKITLFFTIVFCVTIGSAQSIEITGLRESGAATFQTVSDFATARTGGGVNARLEIGESLQAEIVHSNLPAAPGSTDARIVVRYAINGGGLAVGFNFLNVPAGAAETTSIVDFVVADHGTANNPEPAILQAFAAGNFATNDLESGFNIVSAGTLSTINLKKSKLSSSFYISKTEQLIIGEDVVGSYSIFNLLGQNLLKGKVSNVINVATLKSGVYILSTDSGYLKFAK